MVCESQMVIASLTKVFKAQISVVAQAFVILSGEKAFLCLCFKEVFSLGLHLANIPLFSSFNCVFSAARHTPSIVGAWSAAEMFSPKLAISLARVRMKRTRRLRRKSLALVTYIRWVESDQGNVFFVPWCWNSWLATDISLFQARLWEMQLEGFWEIFQRITGTDGK